MITTNKIPYGCIVLKLKNAKDRKIAKNLQDFSLLDICKKTGKAYLKGWWFDELSPVKYLKFEKYETCCQAQRKFYSLEVVSFDPNFFKKIKSGIFKDNYQLIPGLVQPSFQGKV